jgi:AraC-like DNA-binding protein
MPSVTTKTTADVDEFRGLIRPENTEFLVTGKGPFTATVTKIDLFDLGMQSLTESHARAWHIALSRSRVGIAFSAKPGPTMIYGGKELGEDSVALITPDMDVWQRLPGSFQNSSLSLPEETVTREAAALFGHELTPMRRRPWLSVPQASVARLRRLHAAALDLAANAPEIITNPGAAKGLESALTEAFFDCLTADSVTQDGLGRHSRWRIVKRLYALAEQHPAEPLFVADVCNKLGVPLRVLNRACNEHLGIGPKQYLTLRRLHLAHRALRLAPPGEFVTNIATKFGFWELGRFAVVYRSIFGETPSTTLAAGSS